MNWIDIISAIGTVVGVAGLIVGGISLYNTSLIKSTQIEEINRAKDMQIYKSDMPRIAMIEKPNKSGVGVMFLKIDSVESLLDYMGEHPDERVVTARRSSSGPYNKIEYKNYISEYTELD